MNIYSLSMQIFNKTQVNEIAFALNSGKAAILPTDTVWGIASLSERHIYQIKRRDPSKKIIKFVGSIDEIGLPSFYADVLKNYWPGALSVVWKGFSYRIPKSQYILDIIKQTGPIYCSSANVSGQPTITMSQEAFHIFKDHLDGLIIVDNSPYDGLSQDASTIIDLDSMKVVREGPINGQEILEKLKRSR